MKNKLMRLASVMLVLTLLTTCGVSGTYAKYVTTASASDTARVAKFGVTIATNTAANTSMFKTSYARDTTDAKYAAITNSVQTNNTENTTDYLVAPGTKNSGSSYFTITGKPEVAVEISYGVSINDGKEPVIPAGTYRDWTKADDEDAEITVPAGGYYPVKFTLKQGATTLVDKGTLTQLKNALAAYTIICEPGTDLSSLGTAAFELSWEWAFEDNNVTNVNALDTLLGQKAAGVDTSAGIVTDLDFALTVTVTQID